MIAGFHLSSLGIPSFSEETSSAMPDLHPFIYLINFTCVGALPAYISVNNLLAWCPYSPEEGPRFPEIGVTDSCALPFGCWESNLYPQKEQYVLNH